MTLAQASRSAMRRSELGREKYGVLKAAATALAARSLPPMDEGCKSIFASQVGTLLGGGYSIELVRRVAVELALSWDERRGHNRLLHLSARVRAIDVTDARGAHDRQRTLEREPLAPRVAALVAPALTTTKRPSPNAHAFVSSDEPNSCSLCSGPVGVHVRLVKLDDDGRATVVPTGLI